ncbi:MAG TPA: hypothetical protein VIM96_06660 [Pseudomonadales bacterium]
MATSPQQMGLFLDNPVASGDDPADALPGMRLAEHLWRLPQVVGNGSIAEWLNRWAALEIPKHHPRWITLIGAHQLPHELMRELRDCGLPTLLLRPQPGTPLELLAEHALQSGKSDIVIAPMPSAASNWLQRYNAAATKGKTRALLI